MIAMIIFCQDYFRMNDVCARSDRKIENEKKVWELSELSDSTIKP